jgi:hypothetical protein
VSLRVRVDGEWRPVSTTAGSILLDQDTREAVREELQLYRMAAKRFPDTPIGKVKDCACMGPLPECRCAKRERLVSQWLKEAK